MIRRFTPLAALILALFLSFTSFAQNPGTTASKGDTVAKTASGSGKPTKEVVAQRIESDMEEALSVIQANHGKTL